MSGGEVRVAIAGTGFIGAVHARSARIAGARLVGVAASSPERGLLAAAALGAERSFATAEELVEAPDVDVVHICTPNHLHLPLAEAALAAGKHVVCEKPLAVDDRGAEEMVEAALAAGRMTAVPFVYRYYPTVREARERVRTGVTGRVRLIHGGYLQDWLLRPSDDNWRVDESLGGASRAFADIGSHWCDLAEFVSGHRITRVSARRFVSVPERVTEDAVILQFETDHGAVGSAVISQISAGRKNQLTLEIDGAEEALAFNQEEPESAVGRPARERDADQARPGRPVALGGAPGDASRRSSAGLQRLLRRVRRRRLRGGASRARRPTACRTSVTGCAPRGSPPPCSPRRAPRPGSTFRTRRP